VKKVLIVDDNTENLYYLNVLVKAHNFVPVEAHNGKEALDILGKDTISLIISDILMPVMDGFNFCKLCKADEKFKSIPFIFYTATYTDASDKKFALQLGADRFLIKPSEPEVLLNAINEVLTNLQQGNEKLKVPVEESELINDDKTYYKGYSETLIKKLEKKMLELEQTNKELTIAKDKAEEMNRLKTSFLENMNHEIRTPMVGILGVASVLKDESDDLWVQKMAGIILKSASRLMDTLTQILDLSSLESEDIKINYTSFNLVKTISESVNIYLNFAFQKSLFLTTNIDVQDIQITSDEHLIKQAVSNLLNNAVKFTDTGGVNVSLTASAIEGKEFAIIKIQDTGIGIEKEEQDKIWNEFKQVSEGWGRSYEGIGLGLTLTKRIIEKIDGSISLESEKDKGTTVTIQIPLNKNLKIEPKTQPGKKNQVTKPEKKPLILLVDDDHINLVVISDFLKNNFMVDTAIKGIEAIEAAKSKKYSLILMDINLGGGISGLSAAQMIKQMPGYDSTPIIAMTAYAMSGDEKRFIEKGCTHYIAKPFDKTELLEFLKTIELSEKEFSI